MPRISDLKETALYVDDLPRAKKFYQEVMGLPLLVDAERFCAFDISGKHVLLLFVRGASLDETPLHGGFIPPHDGAGSLHCGFSIDREELPAWRAHLAANHVQILSELTWPLGGTSLYFHDPDAHLLELLTPGVWATY